MARHGDWTGWQKAGLHGIPDIYPIKGSLPPRKKPEAGGTRIKERWKERVGVDAGWVLFIRSVEFDSIASDLCRQAGPSRNIKILSSAWLRSARLVIHPCFQRANHLPSLLYR
ncbi:MAG: hypothetical protein U1F63_04490 [Chitinivorax sp.]